MTELKELAPGVPNPIYLAMQERKKLEWASWAETEYTKCKMARTPFENQWYINLAFYLGKQYVVPFNVPGAGFRLTSPKVPPWRVRLVINKIRMAMRTEMAKLTSNRAVPVVVPASNEDEDWSAARVGELLLKAEFNSAEFSKVFRSWVFWGSICGVSYLKSFWDPNALDYNNMTMPERPTIPGVGPVPDELVSVIPGLAEQLSTPQPAKGKISIERINPFHIYVPDLLAEDINQQPYVIQVMTRSPLWVEKAFGFTPAVDSKASDTVLDAATLMGKGSQPHLDSVLVKEIWIKPGGHRDFPKGGFLTVINGKVVQVQEEWPWPFPDYPYYKYDGLPNGGFYSDSIIVDLIPVQKEYNRTRSQIIEIKNTMGKPKLLYPKGSINPRMISSEPGQSIGYTAGYERPTVMPAAEVPVSFLNEVNTLTAEFDDISGQHEITRGNTPSQVTSGTAIAFLQEQDDTKLSYQVASIENCMQLLGKHYLKFVATFWDTERIVKVTGKDNSFESFHWKGNDLKGNTDVRVQSGSALPSSKAAKQALVMEMMQNGFMDPLVGLEIMDFGGYDKAMEDVLVDKRQAQRENLKLASLSEQEVMQALNPPQDGSVQQGPDGTPVDLNTGQPWKPTILVPVNSYDNHEQHIHWHNQYRKTQDYELLPEANKQMFELHVQLHQMSLMGGQVNQQGYLVQPGAQQQQQPEPEPEQEEEV